MGFKKGDVVVSKNHKYDRRLITSTLGDSYQYKFLWGGCVTATWSKTYIEEVFRLDQDFIVDKVLGKYLTGYHQDNS